ncbi:MAG: hypothetical protein NC827_08240 [Candidatus Omnitrophica bacterium]|nr:hypothetical protein [Candidatus Omnitrophota bacterium]
MGIQNLESNLIKSDDFNRITMQVCQHSKLKNNKLVTLATGITTAYNIADNQLREFLIVNKISKILNEMNIENKVLLINDTYDPLTERYFERLIKFDSNLKNFNKFIGIPISNIPCPYGCHNSLGEHFHNGLIKKLNSLEIYPVEIFSHKIYKDKTFQNLIEQILIRHDEIKNYLKVKYNLGYSDGLFKAICKKCGKIVATKFKFFKNIKVYYKCKNCGNESKTSYFNGKFTWRIDCVVRWIANNVDFEPFYKNYLTKPNGSYWVSSDISLKYFNFLPPLTIQIEYLRYDKKLTNPTQFLPIQIIENLYLENFHRTNRFNRYAIIAKSKNFRYPSGISFYQASMIIGCLFLKNYEKTYLEKINQFVFGFEKNNTNIFRKIIKNITLAQNFYETMIPSNKKVRLNKISDIKLPKNKKDRLLLSRILRGEKIKIREKNRIFTLLYKILFNKPFGPAIDTILNLLPSKYKDSLINRLCSDIL